jgi:RHS repeat-associated protein
MRTMLALRVLGTSLLLVAAVTGTATAQIGGGYVTVTPDGATTPTRPANSGPYTADFVVTNTDPGPGQTLEDFNILCGGAVNVTCTGVSQAVVSLAPGQWTTVTATYTVAGPGSGEVSLTAMSDVDPEWDEGYYTVPVQGVAVTPDGTTTPNRTPNTGGYSETFTVRNIGGAQDAYTLTCTGSVNVTCGFVTPASVTLAPNTQQNVTASYATGPAGTGTLTLTAASATATDAGFYTVPVVGTSGVLVAVSPDGDTVLVFQGGTSLTQRFLVKNASPASHGYTLTTTCTGAASGCSTQPASPITLSGGESEVVTVMYQTNTTATGLVKLFATQSDQSTVKDSGWVPLRTVAAPFPVISLAANPGRAVARGLCLTIAAGSDAAIECGDLRIVHPLPAIRTLNRGRQPALLYTSAHAAPYPVIVAHVTPAAALDAPDSVEAILRINGVQKASGRWPRTSWVPGQTRQIGLGYAATTDTSKVYDYTMEVATFDVTGRHATTLSGKLIIVNRATSAFGAGWWVAGLERLEFLADGSKLWIGGDGSARHYTSAGTNVWMAPGVARPDTLKWDGTTYYVRVLASGDTVKFNSSGQHVRTVNRLGHLTTFAYASGRLSTITLPTQGGSQQYAFTYTGGKLTSVTAPPAGAQSRVVTLTQTSGKVTQIRDPNNTTVGFTYTGNLIDSRTDRRLTITRYSYDVAQKLSRAKIELSATDSIRLGFQAAERSGFFTATPKTATDTAQVYSTVWGARQYATGSDFIAQSTKFWLDRFGGPRKIQNVLGQTTTLSQDDAQYPVLVTRSQAPNGRVVTAGYDGRGNIAFSTDSANQNATTRYAWDGKWNFATRVVPPMGDSVVIAYDAGNGNRLWQQDARGGISVVQFFYGTVGLLDSVSLPGQTTKYRYTYDARWNLATARTPLGIRTRTVTDSLGRDTLVVAPIGTGSDSTRTRTIYDLIDRVTRTSTYGPRVRYTNPRSMPDSTVPESLVVSNTYDAEGNLTNVWRYVDQDGSLTTSLATSSTYDRANRAVTVTNSGKDSTVYDPAGNAVRTITARGHTLTMQYDALDRLIRREVPQVDYPQATCGDMGFPSGCGFYAPLYPNFNVTALRIATRVDTFAYDVGGNLTRAWNDFARVSRTYNLDGTIATDTLRLRDYSGTGFTTHVYGLSLGYDLNDRRTRLTHPTNIDPANAVDQLYAYTTTGALASVRSVKNNYYRFFYDAQDRLDSLKSPGGWERYEYDADGRRIERTDWAGSATLQHDVMSYDQRGAIATATSSGGVRGWNASNVYSGLGQLVLYDAQSITTFDRLAEEFRPDGLSSQKWRRVLNQQGSPDPEHEYRYDITGRLTRIVGVWPANGPPQPPGWYPDTTYNSYDAAGNVRYAGWQQYYLDAGSIYWSRDRRASASFYAADGQLVVQQLHRDSINRFSIPQKKRGIYEEYWYDALGRRVLARRRADSLCTGGTSFCVSTLERFVWDGDQILYELRAPGGDNLSGAQLDDTPPYLFADYKQFGWLAYTHGPGLDAPLDLLRMDYNGVEYTVLPHTNWRGAYGAGTDTLGAQYGFDIQWPADFRRAYHNDDGFGDRGLPEWFGSLIQGKRDQTGLMYMRNRYYDPNSGRFTQEDPIGLAGGLNLYGFAAGDPVNFSDPFGLCPPPLLPVCAVMLGFAWFGGSRIAINAAYDRPLDENVQRDAGWGMVAGLAAGSLAAAPMAADATATTAAAGAAPHVGRHAGWVAEMARRTPGEIARSIRSLERVAAQHAEWIRNPTSKIPDFYQRSAAEQASLLRQWGQTIVDRTQQANLLRDLHH